MENDANRLSNLCPLLDDIKAIDLGRACRRRDKRREHQQSSRFAGSVRAQQAEYLTEFDHEVQAIDRDKIAVALGEVPQLDARHGHCPKLVP